MRTVWTLSAAAIAAALVAAAPATARDPAYQAARTAGQVGELRNGYLGVVTGGPAIQRLVDDINIRRRQTYTEDAQKVSPPATLEEYALTGGCINIARTDIGEKYQGLDNSWKTRTAAAPERDPRCPALQAKNAQ